MFKMHPEFCDPRWAWLRNEMQGSCLAARALIVDPTATVVKPKPRKRPAAPAPARRCRKCGGLGRPDKPGGVCKYCGACSDIMPTEHATPAPRGERRRG